MKNACGNNFVPPSTL